MSNNETTCKHPDIRIFDNIRCCLACGTSIIDSPQTHPEESAAEASETVARREYTYNDLNYELGQEIRLVVLLPGLPSEPLRCEIIHANLDSNPNYEAVSYTWATQQGDAEKRETINCPGRGLIQITANCASSLKQLCYTTCKRRLWVDAICIHQANIRERTHQVQLMGQIYSKALRVLICITYPFHDYSCLYQYLRNGSMFDSLGYEVRSVLRRRWFSRVWVIQEIALAKSVVMVCNKYSIPLTQEVVRRLAEYLKVGEELPSPLRWSPGAQMGTDILTCLQATRNSSATDPRDKIYGIMNLLDPNSRSLIDIDYSSGVAHVYAKTAIAVVKQQQTLEILSHATVSKYDLRKVPTTRTFAQRSNDRPRISSNLQTFRRQDIHNEPGTFATLGKYNNDLRLASWVPDWRRVRRNENHQFHMENLGPWTSSIKLAVQDERGGQKIDEGIEPNDFNVRVMISNISIRFYVRGHYIDSIDSPLWMTDMNVNDFLVMLENLQSIDMERPDWRFRWSSTAQSYQTLELAWKAGSTIMESKTHIGEWQQRYGWDDFFPPPHKIGGQYEWPSEYYMFRTRHSVGYMRDPRRDDIKGSYDIFAIDGVRDPLVLQKSAPETNSYELVTECRLLAALELDKLNTPDSKGLFNDQQEPHPLRGWSGMIELV